ncbi:MAG: hypothetical protein ACLQM8_00255 [Limisphaerales bacterium]
MSKLLLVLFMALGCAAQGRARAQTQMKTNSQPVPVFSAAGANEYSFDTGVLRGKLRAEGRSRGLSSVVYVSTGMRLDSSMGLLSHYRVFSAGKRYGTAAWDWPGEATLGSDGAVEARWPAADGRPFELRARYRWAAPNILDLETTVLAKTNLLRFESFLASYFTADFTNALVWAAGPDGRRQFIAADKSYGAWLAFPRDEEAAAVIRDGRWKFEPNPVDWVVMPALARPLAVRRAPATGLTAVLTSPASDCFAVCTPQQSDPHDSLYLSLFGRDLKEGETARARVRLLIAPELSEAEILKEWAESGSGR